MKQIIVTVPLKGPVKIETSGFSGADCKKATERLQNALGITTEDTPTEEMFSAVAQPEGQAQ